MAAFDQDEIVRLAAEYGGAWGLQHTRRMLNLIVEIGEGLAYDTDIEWLSAHLHDWGAYPAWAQPGVDHCIRSSEVANTFLTERGIPNEVKAMVLEFIELHHTAGTDRCLESILLRDADTHDEFWLTRISKIVS
jgi:HD superfamily phosphodiesterase